MKIFLVLGILLVAQSMWSLYDGMRFRRLVKRRRISPIGNHTPSAVVLIPCKGLEPEFDSNLDRFLGQNYPVYQIIFIVASADDAAYRRLKEVLDARDASKGLTNPRTLLVVAGETEARGEKVNNLLHGIEKVDQTAQVLVFADMDAAPASHWLRALVAPLENPDVTVSTGYRWYLPGQGLASKLRAAWDTSIATMLGDHAHNFAWGGSMAIRAEEFRKLRIAEQYWAHTVSDDLSLTRAVRDAGGRIVFEPRCLVASREESSVAGFFRWSTRQIILTRIYSLNLWRLGFAASFFNSGTFLLGLVMLVLPGAASTQRITAAVILIAVLLLGTGKGFIRTLVAREIFSKETDRDMSCYWQLASLISWIMLANFIASAFTRRIEWRGTVYELASPNEVRILSR
jgi:ceramide glucosyltransferase